MLCMLIRIPWGYSDMNDNDNDDDDDDDDAVE